MVTAARTVLLVSFAFLCHFALLAQSPAGIMVLCSEIRFENIRTEERYSSDRFQSAQLRAEMLQAAQRRLETLHVRALPADSADAVIHSLAVRFPELFRKTPPADLIDTLAKLAQARGLAGVLVMDLLGRVGEDASLTLIGTGWDHSTHLCRLRAVFIRPNPPQRFWIKESVGRFLPQPQNKKFTTLLHELTNQFQLPQ